MILTVYGFFICCLGIEDAYAKQRESLEAERYTSTRAAGMGGVGLSHVTDWNAAFLNPALIGDPFLSGSSRSAPALRSFTFPGLSAESTENSAAFLNSLSQAQMSGDQEASDDELIPILESFDGTNGVHFRQQIFPNIVIGRFLFGVYQSNLLDMQSYKLAAPRPSAYAQDPSGATVSRAAEVFARSEIFGVLGFSVPVGKRASLGFLSRYGARSTFAGDVELGAGTEKDSTREIFDRPLAVQGFSVDTGLAVAVLPSAGLSVSAVARNIGEGHYAPIGSRERTGGVHETDPLDLDLGFAFSPRFRRTGLSPSFSAEYQNALQDHLKPIDRLKIGGEMGFANVYRQALLALRAGYDFAAPSFGVSLDVFLFRIELARYNHVVKLPEDQVRNETRYLVRTSWDLQN